MQDIRETSVLRVEKGSPSPEELAAITAVLLARTTTTTGPYDTSRRPRPRPRATWTRPERTPGFQGPRTWRTGA
ncbi:acyl-CoA carboxylase subunit epsilon [Streptomyces deccanensis]|uniref:acyl-CoA carboxylase subunit epsilon n=1 Tax=Streptomyces deccanensis TaxID=424188 RepID=UPI001EFBE680|nr:acyl-CoA carboxylase subunit epsilon [Streptomyces deccanensis]ULR51536.1 acyl-CoA carboxylase subunit epsilon [Streptomyces deccanensis]